MVDGAVRERFGGQRLNDLGVFALVLGGHILQAAALQTGQTIDQLVKLQGPVAKVLKCRLAVEDQHGARAAGYHGRRARPVVEKGHLSDHIARLQVDAQLLAIEVGVDPQGTDFEHEQVLVKAPSCDQHLTVLQLAPHAELLQRLLQVGGQGGEKAHRFRGSGDRPQRRPNRRFSGGCGCRNHRARLRSARSR